MENSIFKRTEMPLCVPGKSAIRTIDGKVRVPSEQCWQL